MLGAYKARAVPINVNYRYVADETRYILENSDSVAVVFERAFAPVIDAIRDDLPLLRHFVMIEDGTDHPTDAVPYEDALAVASPERDFARAPPTTSTSSTPAGRPASPRASCGGPRTSSSPRSAAEASGSRRSGRAEELAERVAADDDPRRSRW